MTSKTDFYHRPLPAGNKFKFFSTGNYDLLMKGFDVVLDMSYTPEQCKNYLYNQIAKKIDIKKGDLLIYVSGGHPFIQGTLGDIYEKPTKPKAKHYIYGILTSPISNIDINNNYYELCNINDDIRKIILSPLYESDYIGLCNMACLLGYLNHDGTNSDLFLRAVSATIHFPPLITSLNKLIERTNITGRDVITICSTLYTFTRWMIPKKIKSDFVYDYILRSCNILCQTKNIPETLPLSTIEIKPDMPENQKYLTYLFNSGTVYVWDEDFSANFEYVSFDQPKMETIDESYEKFSYFTPISPSSIRVATGCSIVRGKEHTFLYLQQSPQKDTKSQDKIDIIDPMTGFSDSYDFTTFSRDQGDSLDKMVTVDQDQIKQIIMVCIDTSKRMSKPFYPSKSGKKKDDKNSISRQFAATQYLTIFANRLYAHRINCILGLISFNKEATIESPFSPLIDQFEDKILNGFELKSYSDCTKSITKAYEELIKISDYPKSTKRIVLITAGNDLYDINDGSEITRKLFENKIILDTVAFGSEDDFHELITMSHITGGLCFNPTTISEGLSLFEKSAFLDYTERNTTYKITPILPDKKLTSPSKLKLEMINNELIEEGSKNSHFDTKIINLLVFRAQNQNRFSTPRNFVFLNRTNSQSNKRTRRILRELYYISQIMNEKSRNYDPNLVVLTFDTMLDKWIAFLKGEENTVYEGKWFELFISFPETYPTTPPVIRFMSIPYHLNISCEGRICLNILDKGYMPSYRMLDIIQEIKEVFVLPNPEAAVQIEILETFLNDNDFYYKKAKESADLFGKNDYKMFLNNKHFIRDVASESEAAIVYDEDLVPLFMISQMYGRPIRDPVLASSGVYYERDELRQIVSSNRNPTCVVTGRRLTENVDNI